MASPHYRHGMRSVLTEETRESFRQRAARIRREVMEGAAEGKRRELAAMFHDLSARLFVAEVALFGAGRGWFEVSPRPEDGTPGAALWPEGWHPAAAQLRDDLDAAREFHAALTAAMGAVTPWTGDGGAQPLERKPDGATDATP